MDKIKKILPSEDILTYAFSMADKTACTIVYADGVVNKQLLGDLIARPLSLLCLPKDEKGGDTGRNEKQNFLNKWLKRV